MTIIFLNDDRTIHSIQYSDEAASPFYVVHRDFKFYERVSAMEIAFKPSCELQKKAIALRNQQP